MIANFILDFIKSKKQKDKQHILIIKNIRLALEKIRKNIINVKEKQTIDICIRLCLRIEKTRQLNEDILSQDTDTLIKNDLSLLTMSCRNTRLLFSIMTKYISNW